MSALEGIRVVDLTRILAGPFCTALLADMGADVVKIESPKGGDPVRGQGEIKDGLSWYFALFNRNKRSMTLDLYSDEGKQVLADMVRGADVLVENFKPGVLAKLGLTTDRLEELNPRLISASVNGFGSTGPYADRPAFDFIAQAMSGFMSVTGNDRSGPVRAGPPISDLIAGLYCAFGIVSALAKRGIEGDGQGQHVEASLVNGLISMMAYFAADYFSAGKLPQQSGNNHPIVAPYGLFEAKDGPIAVAASQLVTVDRFLEVIGLTHILQDERFATNAARMKNRAALNEVINQATRQQTVDDWIQALNAAGCPCGKVQDLAEVFSDPQVLHQEMIQEIEHPGYGRVKVTGFPVKMSRTPCQLQRPAPRLGEHTNEVIKGLGYDDAKIAALRAAGIF